MKNKMFGKRQQLILILFAFSAILSYGQQPTPCPTGARCGDVNCDCKVDIVDALLIAQSYVGLIDTLCDTWAADVNCDDTIDIVDALLVAQYYVGLVQELECCSQPEPTPDITVRLEQELHVIITFPGIPELILRSPNGWVENGDGDYETWGSVEIYESLDAVITLDIDRMVVHTSVELAGKVSLELLGYTIAEASIEFINDGTDISLYCVGTITVGNTVFDADFSVDNEGLFICNTEATVFATIAGYDFDGTASLYIDLYDRSAEMTFTGSVCPTGTQDCGPDRSFSLEVDGKVCDPEILNLINAQDCTQLL